jgi:hypothetical protein
LALTGVKDNLVGEPVADVTLNVAVALARPVADTVTDAAPAVVGVKFDVATPLLGVIGEAGLKAPEAPLSEKVMGWVALVTRLP